VTADLCAPERTFLPGAGSTLRGRFAALRIAGDHNVVVQPCGGVGGALICACFDAFSPTAATVGAVITFSGGCDLRTITGIRICGIDAPIVPGAQTATTLQVTVPAGATGACTVQGLSTAGTFTASSKLLLP
jgi:hypothetical protein